METSSLYTDTLPPPPPPPPPPIIDSICSTVSRPLCNCAHCSAALGRRLTARRCLSSTAPAVRLYCFGANSTSLARMSHAYSFHILWAYSCYTVSISSYRYHSAPVEFHVRYFYRSWRTGMSGTHCTPTGRLSLPDQWVFVCCEHSNF